MPKLKTLHATTKTQNSQIHFLKKKKNKTQHSRTKIMASSPTISRQIDGTTMETVTDFIFLGSKIIVDVDSCHEIERRLLIDLWKAWLLMLSFI